MPQGWVSRFTPTPLGYSWNKAWGRGRGRCKAWGIHIVYGLGGVRGIAWGKSRPGA